MEKKNRHGQTFDEWFSEFKKDYKCEYSEMYPNNRSPHEMIEYWEMGWDLAMIEEYEAWRDYTPI